MSTQIHTVWSLTCDNCNATFSANPNFDCEWYETEADLLSAAHTYEWSTANGKHWCENCWILSTTPAHGTEEVRADD